MNKTITFTQLMELVHETQRRVGIYLQEQPVQPRWGQAGAQRIAEVRETCLMAVRGERINYLSDDLATRRLVLSQSIAYSLAPIVDPSTVPAAEGAKSIAAERDEQKLGQTPDPANSQAGSGEPPKEEDKTSTPGSVLPPLKQD